MAACANIHHRPVEPVLEDLPHQGSFPNRRGNIRIWGWGWSPDISDIIYHGRSFNKEQMGQCPDVGEKGTSGCLAAKAPISQHPALSIEKSPAPHMLQT